MFQMKFYSEKSEFKDLYRLCIRGMLVVSPFFIAIIFELFILRSDFFTFRIWEAALSIPYRYPGMYFPNLHIKKEKEYGDRYRLGIKESRPVEWFTDAYGWRNRPEIERRQRYDAVVIGDSNIVGSFLDQKNTLAEVLAERAHKTVYSYASESTAVALFFSDPRPVLRTPSLIVIESKAANWFTNNSFLINFREMPDGSLALIDRRQDFATNYYSPDRNLFLEKLQVQFGKHSLWHALKAELSADFSLPERKPDEVFTGRFEWPLRSDKDVWRPLNWIFGSGVSHTGDNNPGHLISIRKTGQHAYLRTDMFTTSQSNGQLIARFEARSSITTGRYKIGFVEDGFYRPAGEIVVDKKWGAFEVPVTANPGSSLAFQIEQADNWQSLSIKNFSIIHAKKINDALPSSIVQSIKQSAEGKITFPRPANLTPLDGSGHPLTIKESQYYFYQAVKALQRKANARQADFIFFLMPDANTKSLLPVVLQLRKEGIRIIAYQSKEDSLAGVDNQWYWEKADTHWTEAAVRLTADEILRMWRSKEVANRPFSKNIVAGN